MARDIRIVIADDHPVLRNGLRNVIENSGLNVIGEAADGAAALELIRQLRPDVVILDIHMPVMGGFDTARAIRKENLPIAMVFLTGDAEKEKFEAAMDLGATGYVLKENAVADIVASVRSVAAGRPYISPSLSGHLLNRFTKTAKLSDLYPGLKELTQMERRILGLIARGKSSKEISKELFIHSRTVDNHRTNISQKLGLRGPNGLLRFSIDHKAEISEFF